jgi:predicted ArsR family transcriptional regulator
VKLDGTRDAVARLVLERGPQTAAALAERLELSPAAVRRHLDALVDDGLLVESRPRPLPQRGRGRPARVYALTDSGRASFPHAYDDLATTALRYLRDTGGEDAVVAFAEHRADTLAGVLATSVTKRRGAEARATALADALTANGYASTTETVGNGSGADRVPVGVQICQHHCRSRTSRPSSRNCVRPRPAPSSACSARTSRDWPRSPTGTASARRTSR